MSRSSRFLQARPGFSVSTIRGQGPAADAELACSYRDLIIGPNRARWRAAIERGIGRGELSSDTDVDLVVNALAAPLFFSLLITGEPIDDSYARAAVDLVFARYGTTVKEARP
jgi:hypothetical protein